MSTQLLPFSNTLGPKSTVVSCNLKTLTTWIAIKLVDENNKPIGGAKYVIIFPDKTKKEDVLDQDGYAFFPGIPEGECDVGFPELDPFWDLTTSLSFSKLADPTLAGFGSGAATTGVSQLPPPVSVDIQLLDEAGKGIPKEKFKIKLPNGDVAQGFLEDDGTAHVDGIIPGGGCEVSFPDLDGSFVTYQGIK